MKISLVKVYTIGYEVYNILFSAIVAKTTDFSRTRNFPKRYMQEQGYNRIIDQQNKHGDNLTGYKKGNKGNP